LLIDPGGLHTHFVIPLAMIFLFPAYIPCATRHCCHIRSLRSKSLLSVETRETSKSPSTLTGRTANVFLSAEVETVNQRSAMGEASEKIEQPQTWQNRRLKSRPDC
jgi:hypothetical protein